MNNNSPCCGALLSATVLGMKRDRAIHYPGILSERRKRGNKPAHLHGIVAVQARGFLIDVFTNLALTNAGSWGCARIRFTTEAESPVVLCLPRMMVQVVLRDRPSTLA
jgi:hypothetical protein